MQTYYTTSDGLTIDSITPEEALRRLPLFIQQALDGVWKNLGNAIIAGGFVTFCRGYTTAYGDVDIFITRDVLDNLISGMTMANPLAHLQWCADRYAKHYESHEVFEVWSGSRKLGIQVIVDNHTLEPAEVFTNRILDGFDLDICRNAIYNYRYLSRDGGLNVLDIYMESDNNGEFVHKIPLSCRELLHGSPCGCRTIWQPSRSETPWTDHEKSLLIWVGAAYARMAQYQLSKTRVGTAYACKDQPARTVVYSYTMLRVIKYVGRLNYAHFSQFPFPLERMSVYCFKLIKKLCGVSDDALEDVKPSGSLQDQIRLGRIKKNL